jgi:uncharacterized membrane protein
VINRWLFKQPATVAFTLLAIVWVALLALLPEQLSWLTSVAGAPIVLFLPGWFITSRLGARSLTLVSGLYSVAFSVLNLIAVGLVANYVPRLWGVTAPLHTPAIITIFILELVVILTAMFARGGSPRLSLPRFGSSDRVLMTLSTVSVAASIIGAVRLNNGASNAVSMVALLLMLVGVAYALIRHRRLSSWSLIVLIACSMLVVLLMTSLRGWAISGHDIRLEYEIFNLTMLKGAWNPGNLNTDYNACMSLSIFPVALTQLLHVSGLVVFKLIDQILFVTTPLALFALLRNFVTRFYAFVGAILFVGLPTVSIDLAMLTRQELAFEFLSLALLAWFSTDTAWLRRHWRLIFLFMSAGVIVSHYSTTYLYVVGLVLTMIVSRLLMRDPKNEHDDAGHTVRLSAVIVAATGLMAILWYVQLTSVAGELATALGSSFTHIATMFTGGTKSQAVASAIPGTGSSLRDVMVSYIKVTEANKLASPLAVLSTIHLLNPDLAPTPILAKLHHASVVNVPAIMNAIYYRFGAYIYETTIVIGLTIGLYRYKLRRERRVPAQYLSLAVAMILLLGLLVVVPSISHDYGVTRFFMQAYLVLALPMMLVIEKVSNLLPRRLMHMVVGAAVVILIAIYTNFLPQLTGGLPAVLSLNNSGPYYGLYYAAPSDLEAADWVQSNLPAGTSVSTDDYAVIQAYYPNYTLHLDNAGSLPFQVPSGSYIMLTADQVREHDLYIDERVNPQGVALAQDEYSKYDLVYSSGTNEVYR